MKKWCGASGVCINEMNQILMVLQGTPEEEKTWSIPSGGREEGETFEACCVREIEEETGYKTRILEEIMIKKGSYEDLKIAFEVHYFGVEVVGGDMNIQDPDHLIYDVTWKSAEEIEVLKLTYPEDRTFLIETLKSYQEEAKRNGN
ncbi:NUDIX hydrolase [Pullulanibacillus sp. KACC 23026]|uniref:NUDIX hydrolase n=1 Tax=Pullulanibacillus sp. KACC 23026 TaxID=3028315 RepID=UPI0023B19694|nr:NUDIX hydrolase [Pullulanibacillus sp. KACC 23026]WEG14955.1 NUDIX hydrolase [Pullulanibacillus sp. KACC 23026]